MLSAITTRTRFAGCLAKAESRVAALRASAPEWDLIPHLERRLRHIADLTGPGRVPRVSERRPVGLGVIAIRNFEDCDPDLSFLLKEVEHAFVHFDLLR